MTLDVDRDLLRRARERTRQGVTATIHHGLELVAASEAYEKLRAPRQGLVLARSQEASRRPQLIAIDSSLIAYLSGAAGADVDATGLALQHRQAILPPVVLSELLSDRGASVWPTR